MKILLVATHWENSPARLIARGFAQLGHEVRTYGNYIDGFWKPYAGDISPEWPDIIVETDQFDYYKQPTSKPHVLYAEDPLGYDASYYAYRDIVHFDHEFYADSRDCIGRKNASFLPCAYDPELHKCLRPYNERPIPVAFYGQMDGGRQELVDALIANGIPIATGYADFNLFIAGMQNAQISLCHSRACGNLDQRVFESMAMGCCVVSDWKPDAYLMGLRNEHYRVYKNTDEAIVIIQSLMRRYEKASEIADTGRRWVQPHTWANRCKLILETVGI